VGLGGDFVFVLLLLLQSGELHQVAGKCQLERMKEVLAKKPALNELDESGRTALHVAIEGRQLTCVSLLLVAGAEPKTVDRQGRTAFEAAERSGEQRIRFALKTLTHKAGERPEGPVPWSLESSVGRKQSDVTKMLLALGVDPNQAGKNGISPLAEASLKGDLEAVRALIAKGARLDAISPAGIQAIHDAALGDSGEVIRELVKQGAELNARTREGGQTPLHFAAAMGKMRAVEALLSLGADLRVRDLKGMTALEVAERAGLDEIVVVLRRALSQ
jgi:ankyrin repeat protein